MTRPVRVAAIGLVCPAGIGLEGARGGRPGEVPGFRAHAYVEDRKKLKLMTRAVQLGVAAVRLALAGDAAWTEVPPERRGLYVAASPQPGDPADLREALAAGRLPEGGFDHGRFAESALRTVHPLWLVRGLSNNVLGFASAIHDLQGTNMSYCDGPLGGWTAIVEGLRAVEEERADLVVAGGSDALVGAEPVLGGRPCGEGAAFLVLRPGEPAFVPDRGALDPEERDLGFLGAATWPVALARRLLRGEAPAGSV